MLEKAYFELLRKITPENLLIDFFKGKKLKSFDNVVAIGKAAIPMINAFYKLSGFEKGLVISPFDGEIPENTELCLSTHPDITKKSIACGDKIVDFLKKSKGKTAILLSGGGSALIEKPLDFLTLENIAKASDYLVKSSLPIEEINFFRIHLSKIKGGGLLRFIKGDVECFVLCDVLNNRIDRVSSAPFFPVKRDFEQFVKKADSIDLWTVIGREKRQFFREIKFSIPEKHIPHSIVAGNSTAVDIFSSLLEIKGLSCLKLYDVVKDEVEKESEKIFKIVEDLIESERDAVVAGGEATVKVKGRGKGGRTLEMGLRLIKRFLEKNKIPEIEFLFATTDGIDGNSDSAGIFVDYQVLKKILSNETLKTIDVYLKESNSKEFFEKYNCLIKTGYTGTNLLDVYAVKKVYC